MSRARLELRVGVVAHLGIATLVDFAHGFTKVGTDGTAKGNIHAFAGGRVMGVCYRLTRAQWDLLLPYEDGYEVIEVDLERGQLCRAFTFTAIEPSSELVPAADYLEHYRRGMEENQFPQDYVEAILKQAARAQ